MNGVSLSGIARVIICCLSVVGVSFFCAIATNQGTDWLGFGISMGSFACAALCVGAFGLAATYPSSQNNKT